MNSSVIVLIAALICNEVTGEEMNCEQWNILDKDVFSKALDMLTNILETNQR